jgi:copper resistance protein B
MRNRSAIASVAMIAILGLSAPAKAAGLFFNADLERFEHRFAKNAGDIIALEGTVSYGGDKWKLLGLLKAEYAQDKSAWENVELQGRWSMPVATFWDAYGGIRHDTRPHPARSYLVTGVSGLAPYFIETDASLFVSEKGHVSARLEVEKDLLITQRLVFQPVLKVDLAGRDDEPINVASGFVATEVGLRLRYEITRDFAPYIGVNYERKWADSGRLAVDHGEKDEVVSLHVGLKLSY